MQHMQFVQSPQTVCMSATKLHWLLHQVRSISQQVVFLVACVAITTTSNGETKMDFLVMCADQKLLLVHKLLVVVVGTSHA